MASLGGLVASAICGLVAFSWQLATSRAGDLADFVAEKAAVVSMLDTRAQRAVATIAQDRFVLEYAAASRDDVKQVLRARVEALLVAVSSGLLAEEIVIVATSGKPLARVLEGRIDDDPEIDEDDEESVDTASNFDIGTTYILHMAFGRLLRPGILSHLRSSLGCDEPEFLR